MSIENLPKQNEETHLGDGLYVSFDGYQLKLRAPRIGGASEVYLEPAVYQNLRDWIERYSTLERYLLGQKP